MKTDIENLRECPTCKKIFNASFLHCSKVQVRTFCGRKCAHRSYNQRNKEKVAKDNKRIRDLTLYETLLITNARGRAKKKGWEFSITEIDIPIPERCPLLGVLLARGKGQPGPNSPSVDRIDPTKGYVPGNVWVISYRANMAKSNLTFAELKLLVEHLEEKMTESKLHETRKG